MWFYFLSYFRRSGAHLHVFFIGAHETEHVYCCTSCVEQALPPELIQQCLLACCTAWLSKGNNSAFAALSAVDLYSYCCTSISSILFRISKMLSVTAVSYLILLIVLLIVLYQLWRVVILLIAYCIIMFIIVYYHVGGPSLVLDQNTQVTKQSRGPLLRRVRY